MVRKKRVNKKMKFKKMILLLVIVSLVIVLGAIGFSYAYYSFSETNITTTTKNLTAGQVIFSGSDYINMKTGVPINASDIEIYASKNTFTIVPPNNISGDNSDFAFNVSLVNLSIDNGLKVEDFKYKLKCLNNDVELDISDAEDTRNGNGTMITADNIFLGTFSSENNADMIANNSICTLYVWLEDSGVNQNELMNKKFSTLIKVNTAVRNK